MDWLGSGLREARTEEGRDGVEDGSQNHVVDRELVLAHAHQVVDRHPHPHRLDKAGLGRVGHFLASQRAHRVFLRVHQPPVAAGGRVAQPALGLRLLREERGIHGSLLLRRDKHERRVADHFGVGLTNHRRVLHGRVAGVFQQGLSTHLHVLVHVAGLRQQHLHHAEAVRQTAVVAEQENRLSVLHSLQVREDDHVPQRQLRIQGLLGVRAVRRHDEGLLLTVLQHLLHRDGLVDTEHVVCDVEFVRFLSSGDQDALRPQVGPQEATIPNDVSEDGVASDALGEREWEDVHGSPSLDEGLVGHAVLERDQVLHGRRHPILLGREKVDADAVDPLYALCLTKTEGNEHASGRR